MRSGSAKWNLTCWCKRARLRRAFGMASELLNCAGTSTFIACTRGICRRRPVTRDAFQTALVIGAGQAI